MLPVVHFLRKLYYHTRKFLTGVSCCLIITTTRERLSAVWTHPHLRLLLIDFYVSEKISKFYLLNGQCFIRSSRIWLYIKAILIIFWLHLVFFQWCGNRAPAIITANAHLYQINIQS